MSDQSTYARLTEHFAPDEHKTLAARGGQTYVPWNLVAGRLNEVLGVTGWSFEVMREGFTTNEAWVLGRLTAIIDGEKTTRDQYGCADIMLGQSANTDLLKKAGTDALKKCAQVLGVALYLTDAEERAEVKAAQQAQQRQAQRPKPTPETAAAAQLTGADPTPLKTKVELVADLKKGIEYARSLGLDPSEPDAANLNRAQIEELIEELRKQCRYVMGERKKSQAS